MASSLYLASCERVGGCVCRRLLSSINIPATQHCVVVDAFVSPSIRAASATSMPDSGVRRVCNAQPSKKPQLSLPFSADGPTERPPTHPTQGPMQERLYHFQLAGDGDNFTASSSADSVDDECFPACFVDCVPQ